MKIPGPDDFLNAVRKVAPHGEGASSTEPKPEPSLPPKPASRTAAPAATPNQDPKPTVANGAPQESPKAGRRVAKPQTTKPKALAPDAKINLNCTLARRDAINAAAESLGLTTTAYLLLCEESAVHQLVKHLAIYVETRAQMAEDKFSERLDKLAEILMRLEASR